eukprot:TRINITY_DN110739_c0_g1_i1.p1 TRINITY_DN110739_c0_g1~~TRINITY_DN110739_c0_g1_i1.p1  ORF type:complete len:520 (+),score=88.71 TRINITY_DN110739_c0_g1_i1:62-1621(+)
MSIYARQCRRNSLLTILRTRFLAAAAAFLAVLGGLHWSEHSSSPSSGRRPSPVSRTTQAGKPRKCEEAASAGWGWPVTAVALSSIARRTSCDLESQVRIATLAFAAAAQQALCVAVITAAATAITTLALAEKANSFCVSFSKRGRKEAFERSPSTPYAGEPRQSSSSKGAAVDTPKCSQPPTPQQPFNCHQQSDGKRVSDQLHKCVPEGSQLSASLQNGYLASTFSIIEPMSETSAHAETLLFHAQHQLEGAWYALKMVVLTGLQASDDISDRKELHEVRSLRALADSRHVMRYVTAWCEELRCLEDTLGSEGIQRVMRLPAIAQAMKASPESSSADTHMAVLIVQTELCHGTNLRDWLDSRSCCPLASERRTKDLYYADELHFAEQLAKACKVIHRAGLVHGNLQMQSLFVAKGATLKVGDFSRARPVTGNDQACAGDVLAVGLVCLELLRSVCGLPPALGADDADCDSLLLALEEKLPEHVRLLRRMIQSSPQDRPSACDVHKELKQIRNRACGDSP